MIGRAFSTIVQELELRQPSVVTSQLLEEVISDTTSRMPLPYAVERLVREGWLLPLRTRRAWEFAPGARAGRFGAGDDLIELRALFAVAPIGPPVAVGFESAMFLYGFADHPPHRPIIVLDTVGGHRSH